MEVKISKKIPKTESYGHSDIGCVRKNNEDVWAEMPDHKFFILTDGMGGHRAGEVAAKQAVLKVCLSLENFFSSTKKPSLEKTKAALREAIIEANRQVYNLSCENESFQGMGTTLCCFLLHDSTLIFAHVGDSRVYSFKKNLRALTQDHSLRSEWLRKNQPKEGKTSPFPFKNMITKAIGPNLFVEPDIGICPVEEGDIYFLCSDGLTDYVKDEEIENILVNSSSIKESVNDLIELAKEKGGHDNITVVMIKII